MVDSECIFCKIITKQLPSKIVYENNNTIVFEDISPKAPVHVLIVPKKHIPTILDVSDDDKEIIMEIFKTANKIAEERKISKSGFRLIINCNPQAGQTVYHIHVHLLGGRTMGWPPG